MLRTILKYGVIAGLVVGGFELVTFSAFSGMPPLRYGMVIGYATMLIAFDLRRDIPGRRAGVAGLRGTTAKGQGARSQR